MPDDDAAGGAVPKQAAGATARQIYEDVKRLNERERALTDDVQQLREDVARLDSAQAAAAKPPPPWWWPDLDEDQTTNGWLVLSAWMQQHLLDRFPAAEDVLGPCWPRHPAAVDALTSLHATWWAAYRSPGAEPTASAWWLHQWLPAAINQIREALKACNMQEHHEDRTRLDFRPRLFAGVPVTDGAATSAE